MNVAQTLPSVADGRSAGCGGYVALGGWGHRYRWSLAIAGVLVVVVPALAYANIILNHFYLQGAYFWDTGVVAGAIWRRDAWLTYPPLWPIGSLYAYHVMPLLSVLTVASRYVPLGLPGWFALVTGVGHALPSIGMFWLLAEGLRLRSIGDLAIAAAVSVGIAFTGIPLATVLFPHPEIILAGGLILVFTAIALEHYRIAAALLVFTLLVREDAGFHAFGVLFLLGAANWLRGVSWQAQRPVLILAAVGFLYSAGASAFKLVVFPGQPSLFVLDYLGNPPFSNTSVQQVLLLLIGLPIYRAYVFWPAVVAVAWALWSRNVLIVLGYLAFSPWLLLHLMANRDILRTLSGYYSFPFLVACVWPLAAVVIDARQRGVRAESHPTLAWCSIMLASSFMGLSSLWNPGHMDLWRNLTTLPSLAGEQATHQAVQALLAAEAAGAASPFGTIFTDQSVYSFAPYSFDAATVVRPIERAAPVSKVSMDTFVYFEAGPDIERMRGMIDGKHLTHEYCFTDTAIRLATDRNLDGLTGLERVPPEDSVARQASTCPRCLNQSACDQAPTRSSR